MHQQQHSSTLPLLHATAHNCLSFLWCEAAVYKLPPTHKPFKNQAVSGRGGGLASADTLARVCAILEGVDPARVRRAAAGYKGAALSMPPAEMEAKMHGLMRVLGCSREVLGEAVVNTPRWVLLAYEAALACCLAAGKLLGGWPGQRERGGLLMHWRCRNAFTR